MVACTASQWAAHPLEANYTPQVEAQATQALCMVQVLAR